MLPFFESQGVKLLRILTGRGTEYLRSLQHHEYELYLTLENIDHSKTKARHPQTNGITERFHKTIGIDPDLVKPVITMTPAVAPV